MSILDRSRLQWLPQSSVAHDGGLPLAAFTEAAARVRAWPWVGLSQSMKTRLPH